MANIFSIIGAMIGLFGIQIYVMNTKFEALDSKLETNFAEANRRLADIEKAMPRQLTTPETGN